MDQEAKAIEVVDFFDFTCPSPIEDGINSGYKDGLIQGRREGKDEGFREGFKAGHEFGMKLARLLVPLVKIVKNVESSSSDLETANSLISELCSISLKNEEDPEKESQILQLEARIKVLLANFTKKTKNSSFKVQPLQSSTDLSF